MLTISQELVKVDCDKEPAKNGFAKENTKHCWQLLLFWCCACCCLVVNCTGYSFAFGCHVIGCTWYLASVGIGFFAIWKRN